MSANKTVITIEDVGGGFKRLYSQAPKIVRQELYKAIEKATIYCSDEMYDRAPDRSDVPPHIKDAIDWERRGLVGKAGILNGDEPGGGEATMGEVALYNEYKPNAQPFAMPAALVTQKVLESEARKAIGRLENALGGLG